jgi:uncharacterized protein with PhoU and TrkA domain
MSGLGAHASERVGSLLLDHLSNPVVAAATARACLARVANAFEAASPAANDIANFAFTHSGADTDEQGVTTFC